MFKKILVFYLLVCVFSVKETYASKIKNNKTKIKEEERKYKRRMHFFLGNFYCLFTGLLNFNNINWEYIFIKKWDLKLGLYWGIANLGLGLRINDSLLIRIIGLNILQFIPTGCLLCRFYTEDKNEYPQTYSKTYSSDNITDDEFTLQEKSSDISDREYLESLYDLSKSKKLHIANRVWGMDYMYWLLLLSLFNFLSIEIKLVEYWCFNINFTQAIFIFLKELKFSKKLKLLKKTISLHPTYDL